jgi:hypothetical protein
VQNKPAAITSYAANMDQGVATTNSPDFAGLTIGGVAVATGTPVYVEADPIWAAVSNTVITGAAAGAAAVPASDTAYLAALTNVTGSGGIVITGSGRERDIDGSAFVKTESDPVASSNLTAHIATTGANDAHGMSNTVVLAAGALQRTGGGMTGALSAQINDDSGAVISATNTATTAGWGIRGVHLGAFGVGVRGDGNYGVYGNSDVAGGVGVTGSISHTNATAGRFEGPVVISSEGIAGGTLKLPGGATINEFSTDGTMAGNSDSAVPTEKAVVTYVAAQMGEGGISAATATNIAQTVAAAPIALEQYIGTHITLTPGATVTVPGTAAQYSLTVTNAWTLALTNGHPRYGFVIEVDGTNSMSYPAAWHSTDPTYEAMSTNVISVTPYGTTNWSIFAVGVN